MYLGMNHINNDICHKSHKYTIVPSCHDLHKSANAVVIKLMFSYIGFVYKYFLYVQRK